MIMKQKYIHWIYLLLAVAGIHFAACTENGETENLLNGEPSAGNTDSRGTTPIAAEVQLSETKRLQTQLTATLGNDAAAVQELTVSGTFYAEDVEYLHTLKALEKLDMTNVTIQYNDEHPIYEFSYSYTDTDGNIQEGDVNNYLSQNEIGEQMFKGMTSLKELKMPITIYRIGWEACKGCTSLNSIHIPDNIRKIAWYAFAECGLETVNLPSSLKTIEGYTFYRCKSLKSIIIPEGVEVIGTAAFEGSGLLSIQLPGTLKEMGINEFYNTPLASIEIPASVTTLRTGSFNGCYQLKSLIIPETVTQAENGLFDYCENLTSVYWYPEIDAPDLQWGNEDCVLYLRTKNGKHPSWGPNWVNVAIDNVAESIQLKYDKYSQERFTLPSISKAKKMTVTMNFGGHWTYTGNSSAWQTLTLPFTPQRIYHQEKGELAPFGSGTTGTKPFWLRRLTPQGFADATTIEPNKPYIIAMPYNPDTYLDEYNISGEVVFEATDVDFESIPQQLSADEGPEFYLHPTYTYVKPGSGIYVLNSYHWLDGYDMGSVFTNTLERGARCFEAYATPKKGSDTRTVYAIDTRTANTRSASQPNTSGIPAIGDR